MVEPLHSPRRVRRALVLSGGGAKGIFEAGVIHALIRTGLPLHVLTGSSIGAINSAFLAEYLYHQDTAEPAGHETEEQLRARLLAYLDLWENLAAQRFVDLDSPHFLAIARSLTRLNVSVRDLTRAFWLVTTPDPPPPRLPGSLLTPYQMLLNLLAAARLVAGLSFPLGEDFGEGLQLFANALGLGWRYRAAFLGKKGSRTRSDASRRLWQEERSLYDRALRARLKTLNIERSLFPGKDLWDVLTRPRLGDSQAPTVPLLPAERHFSAYRRAGIDLRFTRTNLRSGRLEYSAFVTPGQALFVRDSDGNFQVDNEGNFVLKQAKDLRVFGDPRVVDAALASGAFPFAFPPRSFEEIYPEAAVEDAEYREMLASFVNYLRQSEAATFGGELGSAPECRWTEPEAEGGAPRQFETRLDEDDWREIASVFPLPGDLYIDGGAIDNTPLASAIAAAREAGATELHIIVVMLEPAPEYRAITMEKTLDLNPAGIGLRGLELQRTAQLEQDADHAEALTGRLKDIFNELGVKGRPQAANGRWTGRRGFMPVKVIRLWPGPSPDVPLPRTLAFDERLGYNRQQLRAVLTQGCAAALWALWEYWQDSEMDPPDKPDEAARRQVMDFVLPGPGAARPAAETWRCANRQCLYFQEKDPAMRCRRAEPFPP